MKTYGKLALDRAAKVWSIDDLAPHVAIAIKRLFTKIPQTATTIRLTDTDETRADLEWFMLRYPLEHAEAEEIAAGSARIAAKMADREKILLPTWKPGHVPGFLQGRQPYLYQSQAAEIAVRNPGLLIGDDVGLGKTITTFAALTMGAPLPAAIVVQPHLAIQWKKRVEEFTTLKAHIIAGRTPYSLPEADIYIFKYSNIAGWTDVIKEGVFKTVAYDEIQELRHGPYTEKGQACAIASRMAQTRLGLTATPIYNYGDEIFQVMRFIKPGLLGTHDEFSREWGSKIIKNPDGLGAYLRDTGYFIRRTEHDEIVDVSMPPANIVEWEVDFDQAEADGEAALMKVLAMKVLDGNFVDAGNAARELDLKMRMITGIAKARSVAAYVRLLLRDTERVLLAGWHREVYSIWQQELEAFDPVLYTGTETAVGKNRSVDEFCRGKSRVMMMSLRSGSGLDGLQYHCQDAVVGELDWSPQVHHQFFGRLRRPGQQKQVTGHYLHTNGGSDPVLLETLGIKSDQSRGINDPGIAPRVKVSDDSRIKRLAQHVLGQVAIDPAAAVREMFS